MPRKDLAYLLDMPIAARDALSSTEDLSFEDFTQGRRTQLSALDSVAIVGQAAAQVGSDTLRLYPYIPRWEIVCMRNRLVDVYSSIDLPLIWDTVRHHRPALTDRLEPLASPEAG
ncbi:MAG: DUF86 domain-containing protein [Bryobacterales bacterium]|nr:DUF86 domain-containing protein [Bryobacterales bacterium]